MSDIQGKRVLLGVTGSIAAYKSPDIVRRLKDQGADVRVVLPVEGSTTSKLKCEMERYDESSRQENYIYYIDC